MTVEPIHNDEDLQRAFEQPGTVFQAEHGTAQALERDALITLIEAYEYEHCAFGKAYPVNGMGIPGKRALAGLR